MIAYRLKQLLTEKNMSQKALADAAGLTEVTISRYIAGTRQPSIENLKKIADALSVNMGFFIDEGGVLVVMCENCAGKDTCGIRKAFHNITYCSLGKEDYRGK